MLVVDSMCRINGVCARGAHSASVIVTRRVGYRCILQASHIVGVRQLRLTYSPHNVCRSRMRRSVVCELLTVMRYRMISSVRCAGARIYVVASRVCYGYDA